MSTENKNQLTKITSKITGDVLNSVNSRIEAKSLTLPKDYSAENALQAAYLQLKDDPNKALEKCTYESVTKALFHMVTKGLNPAKNQCYFIPYGNELKLSVSYMGNIALAKRFGNVKTIKGQAIFNGDDFMFEVDPQTGRKRIIHHKQTLDSLGTEQVIGAYAIIEFEDGTFDAEIMNIKQIEKAWNQGAMKGNSPAHKNFRDQMAIKSVINRATKIVIGSSDDSIFYDDTDDKIDADVKHEVKENANKKEIVFDDAEYAEVENIETVIQESGNESTEQTEIFKDGQPQPGF